MRTNVRGTSLKTYYEIIDSGLLGRSEAIVFKTIFENPGIYDNRIAEITGLKINQVTARRNDLMLQGMVVEAGIVVSHTGREVITWKVPKYVEPRKRPKNREERLVEQFLEVIKEACLKYGFVEEEANKFVKDIDHKIRVIQLKK